MNPNPSPELIQAAQEVINKRGIDLPLNLVLRAYRKKFSSINAQNSSLETKKIGDYQFLVLDPQDSIGAETALLSVIEDQIKENKIRVERAIQKIPKTLVTTFPTAFNSQEEAGEFINSFVDTDNTDLVSKRDFIIESLDSELRGSLVSTVTEAMATAKRDFNKTESVLNLVLFIAECRRVGGDPIDTDFLYLEEAGTIDGVSEYVYSELGKRQAVS